MSHYTTLEFASEYVESTNDKWLAATFMQQRLSRKNSEIHNILVCFVWHRLNCSWEKKIRTPLLVTFRYCISKKHTISL